jgi:regulator of protease activity HflC (stomatin/prohibitin superfamily)
MRLEESEHLERMEIEEVASKSKDAALFKSDESELFPARRSREQFEKYMVPGAALLLLAVQAAGAWYLWRWLSSVDTVLLVRQAELGGFGRLSGLALMGGLALVLFLVGKMSSGVARIARQRLVRPGASYLLLGAYLVALAAVGVGATVANYPKVDLYAARVLVLLLALVGVENLISLVFEVYRPRIKGQQRRLLYESRLVGLVGQPEGIFTTAAHALDYQFGFKVSETWFYQFLQKYLGYFLLAQLAVLALSTCLVFIDPGEQAILEHFGKPSAALLNPGAHLKWPYPIDQVYRYRTEEIQSVTVGVKGEEDEEEAGHAEAGHTKVEQWSVGHFSQEDNFLTASREQEAVEKLAGGDKDQAVPVNLLAVHVPVQFQITNLLAWATNYPDREALLLPWTTNYADGKAMLERCATREVSRYLVSVDLNEAMTTGREKAGEELRQRIQDRANELNLGVKIVFVGLQNIHPPVKIAPAYEAVVAALQEKETKILGAEADAAGMLPAARAEATNLLRGAEIKAIERKADAQAQAALFTNQMAAYAASPRVYAARGYLQALVRGSAQSRKYVLAATNTQEVLQLNLEERSGLGLGDVVVPPVKK